MSNKNRNNQNNRQNIPTPAATPTTPAKPVADKPTAPALGTAQKVAAAAPAPTPAVAPVSVKDNKNIILENYKTMLAEYAKEMSAAVDKPNSLMIEQCRKLAYGTISIMTNPDQSVARAGFVFLMDSMNRNVNGAFGSGQLLAGYSLPGLWPRPGPRREAEVILTTAYVTRDPETRGSTARRMISMATVAETIQAHNRDAIVSTMRAAYGLDE